MFSTTCKYAIRAVLYLTVHSNEEKKLGVDQISEALDIPKHFLAKILQHLTKQKFASSIKGRNGGFYMSKENRMSSLYSIIESIDGQYPFTECILGLKECSGKNPCVLHNEAKASRCHLQEILQNKNIQQVADDIDEKQLMI